MIGKSRAAMRCVRAEDLPQLRSIYADAVGCVGPNSYSAEQVKVWKGFSRADAFAEFVLGVNTHVAVADKGVVGFCGISDDGHVASIYVKPGWLGKGIATGLLDEVMCRYPSPTSGRYYAEASHFSLPLFERCGFRRTGIERVDRDGVVFERFLVERGAG